LAIISKTDFAYLAGIIDGEGYFAPKIGSNTFGLKVRVTDSILIEYLKNTFGGRAYYKTDETVSGKWVHAWELSKMEELKDILLGILPYLIIKKEQAKAMISLIEHIQSKPQWKYPTSRAITSERDKRRAIINEWRNQRENLRVKVKEARLGYYK